MSEAAIEAEVIESTAVVPAEERAPIVRADAGDVLAAFGDYQKIQSALDAAMPDCIMTIRGKQFRKKSYWRAIATAFNLDVEPTDERREDTPDGDWGYCVTYRATANNGRSAIGDGACFASEKIVRDDSGNVIQWKTEQNQTVHNVRAHAHTRAFNRAVSNLVGFGEVSAEEMQYDAPRNAPPPRQQQATAQPASGSAFDQPLGFGKHSSKTWREMSEGDVDGERYSYLVWVRDKGEKIRQESRDRAAKCIELIEKRAAGDGGQPPPPSDEDMPPVGEGVESLF